MTEIYHGMTKEQLDTAYNNTQAVADFPALLENFQNLSKKTYQRFRSIRDIQYADKKRTVFDIFPGGFIDSPTFLFIHGGYWQNCNKEDFAFITDGLLKENISVILAEYTLAPEASMSEIVNEIQRLLDFIIENAKRLPVNIDRFCLAGHSAGGHLTAVHRTHPLITHAMPLSALVDLAPIKLSWLNDKLHLTEKEVEQYSPLRHLCKGVPTHIHVGGGELPELIRHSRDYYQALKKVQNEVKFSEVKSDDHFSQLYQFGHSGDILKKSLLHLLKK